MASRRLRIQAVAAVILLRAAFGHAQDIILTGSVLSGGGGQASGGSYTLNGTIGQPAAAPSSGGAYTLHGGYWSASSGGPVDLAPSIRITLSGPIVIVAWPNDRSGCQLQETMSLASPNWTDVTTPPVAVGSENQVRQMLAPGARWFRLRKP